MKTHAFIERSVALLVSSGLFLPLSALAGSAWSSVTVDQNQSAWSTGGVDLTQSATVETSVKIPGQAAAHSKSSGTQSAWFQGKGHQSQWVSAESGISWDDWSWPSAATAWTNGEVSQDQFAWSDKPIHLKQTAGTWQKSWIGDTKSVADATLWQENVGAIGDATQSQTLHGATEVTGHIDPPDHHLFRRGHPFSFFGGKLVTNVRVFVQSILDP